MTEGSECSAATARPARFESGIFGRSVWQLNPRENVDDKKIASFLSDIVANARARDVGLIWCRVKTEQIVWIKGLRAAQFDEIETLVTLRRPIDHVAPETHEVRIAIAEDTADCIRIGRQAFKTDRFHADPKISDAIADRVKARWIENDLTGRADMPLVAVTGSKVVGFNFLLTKRDEAVIDLIAVNPEVQGQGFGSALIAGALARYAGQKARMSVGTQASNLPSLSLYRKTGFTKVSEHLTFHWSP